MVATTKQTGTTRDKHNKSYVESPQRGENYTAQEVFVGNENLPVRSVTPFGEFDKITATYPTSTREIYTYSLGGVDIGSIVVDYVDPSKKLISEVNFNAV